MPYDYRFESARLNSFQNWSCLWINPQDLAANGFFYTGESDKVKCFECDLILHQWEPGDTPANEHQRWCGFCRFVYDISCGNVPIDTDANAIPEPVPKLADKCNLAYKPFLTNEGSKHPRFADFDDRVESYDKLSKETLPLEEVMASAGFFYSGNDDETLCYYCSVSLRDWKPEDDPFIEHAKWSDKCLYLLLTKGTEFVSNITGKTYDIDSLTSPIVKHVKEKLREKIASQRQSEVSTSSEGTNDTEANTASSEDDEYVEIKIREKIKRRIICPKKSKICKICFSEEITTSFVPCGHFIACDECAINMKKCGICYRIII